MKITIAPTTETQQAPADKPKKARRLKEIEPVEVLEEKAEETPAEE